MEIKSQESMIEGKWGLDGVGKIVASPECERIDWLVNNRFVKIAASTTDWETLYKNSEDESLWELSYPYSGMHGGGPPKLTKLTERSASLKYNLGENT